jgi:dolichol kinase
MSTIISFGLLLQSICQFVLLAQAEYKKTLAVSFKLLNASITSFLIWICLNQGIIFSTVSGVFVILLYSWLLFFSMQKLPRGFTLGEASIVCQGIVLFLFSCYIHLPFAWQNADLSPTDEFKAIQQVILH